jgi:hypothetical protein
LAGGRGPARPVGAVEPGKGTSIALSSLAKTALASPVESLLVLLIAGCVSRSRKPEARDQSFSPVGEPVCLSVCLVGGPPLTQRLVFFSRFSVSSLSLSLSSVPLTAFPLFESPAQRCRYPSFRACADQCQCPCSCQVHGQVPGTCPSINTAPG